MVAPANKQPKHQMTPAQRQLQLEVQRRERHQRRTALAQQREASIKAREALQKFNSDAKETSATSEAKASDTSTQEAAPSSSDVGMRAAAEPKRPPRRPKQAAKASRCRGPDIPRVMATQDVMPENSDGGEVEERQANSTSAATATPDEAAPTSHPTSPSTTASDPASMPTSRPRSQGKQKRRRTGSSDREPENSGAEDDEDDVGSASECGITPGGDLCIVTNGDAVKDTVLDSDDDESSSEDDSLDEGAEWELVCDSEEEGDAAEELPSSLFLQTAKNKALMKEMRHSGWEYDASKFVPDPTYEDLYVGPYGPSASALRVAEDPLALFFYFMPGQLWRKIEKETNTYHVQNIRRRARDIQRKQRNSDSQGVESLTDIRARLMAVQPVQAWEVLRVIGLLVARMLAPQVRGLPAHWARAQHGAIPAGTFGQWLPRHRFEHVTQNLHFTNNKAPQAHRDRGWKVRSVVSTLQNTFARGYVVGPVISFDEAIVPTRARRNPTRQYLPKKPHKWGTKFFSACCADTAYCMRIEMYVGAKTTMTTPVPADNSAGAAAVMRSMNVLLPPSPTAPFRIVITDRYYTSVVLALELLHRRLYFSGTIMTNRSGYAAGVVTEKKVHKNRPPDPPRGTIKLAQNKLFPQMTAAMWMDNNPVHMLSTGGSRQLGEVCKCVMRDIMLDINLASVLMLTSMLFYAVVRRVGRNKEDFPAPGLVRDYQPWVGGVDVHDQLRMQRYSVQLAYKPKKYYRYHMKVTGQKAPEHHKFLRILHEQLLAVDAEKFEEIEAATRAEDRTAASPQVEGAKDSTNGVHYLEECPDRQETSRLTNEGDRRTKRRARTCKVCALYRVQPRKYTKWYCPGCSTGELRKHLCNAVREGRTKTCFQIYHSDWKNGTALPPRLREQHRIQDRRSGPQRKRRRRRVDMEDGEPSAGDAVVDGSDDEEGQDNGGYAMV